MFGAKRSSSLSVVRCGMHYIFCVSGFSGVGKDEFCKRLVEQYGAVHTGIADPAKRHMADVYGFSREQLFGPSHMRNAGDPRYPKNIVDQIGGRPCEPGDSCPGGEKNWWRADITPRMASEADMTCITGGKPIVMIGSEVIPSTHLPGAGSTIRIFFDDTDPRFFLSPRETLQKYCDLMNQMYLCTWVRAGIDVHKKLAECGDEKHSGGAKLRFAYDRMDGLRFNDGTRFAYADTVTCFSDFRHWHEIRYAREEAERSSGDFKAVLVRVKRPGIDKPPFNHRSETEQATIPDGEFDYVVDNNASVEDLHKTVDTIVEQVRSKP